ncbi:MULTISPECIES: TetR/AcrR family transcriptional regulator [Alphaproteobacteria]|uniref:TetR family transcriptional regulator n=2 Tax=Alphaproteobacteria TaxID=28211 RepID=A0A512HIX1_9HYPH|nr:MULTISPECIES: TetR/AcrR family transcriptional regulator [Alphaproteobacteria]GEO85406.1 TetR family transcriptional regulator [Ciceribacter naphthalenivorans]GLR21045.1 TetR family transcriptional regulator [Ciceribacter naphthalenivorans]GLT03901.1 TetR family transcriptional regulator [Sphingomonas psychrolutea]
MDHRHQARERLRKLPDGQRTAWLDTAEEEFRERGFESASLNRILTRAGISKGQAYYYFADKGELYRAVIERAITELTGLIDARLPTPDSAVSYWRQTGALFGKVTTILKRNDRLAELGRGIYREAAAQTAIADLLVPLHDHLERLIETGQQIDAVRSDLPLTLLADMTFAVARQIDQWFALNTQDLDEQRALDLNHRAVGLVIAMLAPDGCSHRAGLFGHVTLKD